MRRIVGVVVGLLSLLVVATPSAHAVLLYSGSLNSGVGGGLTANGLWDNGGITFSWDVNFDNLTNLWTYDYTWDTTSGKSLSHVIVELSPNLTSLADGTSPHEINTYSGADPSNPNMPGPMYGAKFDGASETTVNFTIVTDRAPVWGDVYGKGGKADADCQGKDCPKLYFYNDGFLAADPTVPPANGSVEFHILRPDTAEGPPPPPPPVIPEPSSLLLMGTGLMGAIGFGGARKLRIRKKKEVFS